MSYYNDRVQTRSNSFSRTTASEAKMAFYATESHHCEVIGDMVKMPEEPVCVLEPSIGDGEAVKCFTKKHLRENVSIFGVELDHSRAEQCKADPLIEACIEADFTNGVNISNNAFSLCFGNPPYMDDDDTEDGKKGRLERTFLELVTQRYLKVGGILVWVIPYRIFKDHQYLKFLLSRYEFLHVFKFWPEEYAKWKQVVFIGRKTLARPVFADEITEVEKKYVDIENVPELPRSVKGTDLFESIEVYPSNPDDVTLFAPRAFDAEGAFLWLSDHSDSYEDYTKSVARAVTQKDYTSSDLGKPPIMPKADSLYLMATSGAGQGMAGRLGIDAHMQRGKAEVIEESVFETDPATKIDKEIVTTRTKVSMTIIETNGTITMLE